jgi:thymidine phosphorylase
VTLALAAEPLVARGLAADLGEARAALSRALDSGAAAERFERMVFALGGPSDLLKRARELLPQAPVVVDAPAPRAGFVSRIDVRAVGLAVVELGGGRRKASDAVDPAVGLDGLAGLGAEVGPGRPLARVHARDAAAAQAAVARLAAAYEIADESPTPGPVVIERIVA